MKVTIDPERCSGHGRCFALAPDVLTADGRGYPTLLGSLIEVQPGKEDTVAKAAEYCPNFAIKILNGYTSPDAYQSFGVDDLARAEPPGNPVHLPSRNPDRSSTIDPTPRPAYARLVLAEIDDHAIHVQLEPVALPLDSTREDHS